MTRFFARFSAAIFGTLAAAISLVCIQPYHDAEWQALQPLLAGCATPCFLGIQPGVTTADDALNDLQKHDWITNVQALYTKDVATGGKKWRYIIWDWQPGTPLWSAADANRIGGHAGMINVVNNTVNDIQIATNIPLNQIGLSLGKPSRYWLSRPGDIFYEAGSIPAVDYRLRYDTGGVTVGTSLGCEFPTRLWSSTVIVSLYDPLENLAEYQVRPFRSFLGRLYHLNVYDCGG